MSGTSINGNTLGNPYEMGYATLKAHDPYAFDEGTKKLYRAFHNTTFGLVGHRYDIDHVIFNDPATIVFWKDGTKTVVKCQDDDVFNPETGILAAFVKKVAGKSYFSKQITPYVKQYYNDLLDTSSEKEEPIALLTKKDLDPYAPENFRHGRKLRICTGDINKTGRLSIQPDGMRYLCCDNPNCGWVPGDEDATGDDWFGRKALYWIGSNNTETKSLVSDLEWLEK